MLEFIKRLFISPRHDYKLMGHSNYYRCNKCKKITYIPPYSDFYYQRKQFRGCKG